MNKIFNLVTKIHDCDTEINDLLLEYIHIYNWSERANIQSEYITISKKQKAYMKELQSLAKPYYIISINEVTLYELPNSCFLVFCYSNNINSVHSFFCNDALKALKAFLNRIL